MKRKEHLVRIHAELEGCTDHSSRSVCFVVGTPSSGKSSRLISATAWHHVVVEALEGVWEPIFPHDSYACRKGKVMHRQVMAAEALMNNVG